MSDPIANRQFKHYLNFLNDDIGLIEISEPVKFDAAQFVLEQDAEGYRRDVMFMSEEVSLEFYNGEYEPSDTAYVYENGRYVFKLTHAFDKLKHYYERYGTELRVEYILERSGTTFTTGELLMENTDEATFFKFKVIQRTNLALLKRREDIKIDGFSTEDLDGNEIEPLTTENILWKAKPVLQKSRWNLSQGFWCPTGETPQLGDFYSNPMNVVVNSGIEDTLTFFDRYFTFSSAGDPETIDERRFNHSILRATYNLTDVEISLNNIRINLYFAVGTNINTGWESGLDPGMRVYWYIMSRDSNGYTYYGGDNFYMDATVTYQGDVSANPFGYAGNLSKYLFEFDDLTFNTDDVGIDTRLILYFNLNKDNGFQEWIDGNVIATATSTSIDTVIKGVRYIDLLKQSVKACNGQDVIARDFDDGGEHYKLFAFSGNLIRGRDDVPFYFTYKDRRDNLMAINMDAQINENEVYVGYYKDFYANVDNGGYELKPNQDAKVYFNERYMCNSFEYTFKNYEKDRDEENTLDSVHTESQWANTNKKVENVKSVIVNDAFDTYYIETQRKQEFKETTALDGDDKILVGDCIELSPNSEGGFSSFMQHNINDDGDLQLLKDSELPSWGVLGFGVGDTFVVENTGNAGTYTVVTIEDTIITLSGANAQFNSTGVLTTVSYSYTNVQWTNRTNEGFDLITGIFEPNKFANLRYTMRRNMKHWESFISSCSLYNSDNTKNTFYKNNPNLITQLTGEDEVIENADLVLSEIESPIVSARECERSIVIGYEDAIALFQKYQTEATLGGFIRLQNNQGKVEKVYPKRLGYTWATNVMEITGEIKQEPSTVTITREDGTIYINEVGYDLETLPETFYSANGDYVVLFDENNVNLINFTKYDKFIVQEETFDNSIDLVQAIIDL